MTVDSLSTEQLKTESLALLSANRYEEALPGLARLCMLSPDDPNVWFVHGKALLQLNKGEDAIKCFEKVVTLAPNSADAHFSLGMALGVSNNLSEARSSFEKVLRLDQKYAGAHLKLGAILQAMGDLVEAVKHFNKAQGADVDSVELNVRLGRAYLDLADNERAMIFFKKAYKEQPGHPEAASCLAVAYAYKGNTSRAYELLAPQLNSERVNTTAAITFSRICRELERCNEAIEVLEACLSTRRDIEDQSRLNFELGKLLDKKGNYRKAFEHFSQANAMAKRTYDLWTEARWFKETMSKLNVEFFNSAPRANKRTKKIRPIFIVGMPRSGTTLVEQILASHPSVYGAGELREISDLALSLTGESDRPDSYSHAIMNADQGTLNDHAKRYLKYISSISPSNATVVTDKMPDNYRHLGLIQLLFPKAKVIHCIRNPMDNCLSCYFQSFSTGHLYSYDLKNLGLYYNLYRKLMEHWTRTLSLSIKEVHYETLVNDPENETRSLLEFCGLSWTDKCLNFHKEKRDVITASHDQVRQPLYSSSSGRWKNYENELRELKESLSQRII
ncbi:MAG: tetratricopeptide repeat protein [Gammaproteobacteria bacterium]|nr:tetratricopeptide repeat protein [Gammaproteobacteria bacterium]